jgi:hypothetical protein
MGPGIKGWGKGFTCKVLIERILRNPLKTPRLLFTKKFAHRNQKCVKCEIMGYGWKEKMCED